MNKFLIFDFDGTIADTKSLYYNTMLDKLKDYGYNENQIDKAIDIGLNVGETLRKMGFGFLTSWFLKKQIMKKMKRNINKIKKCKDVDSIKEIKGDKILISNSLKEIINPVIRHFKLRKYFKEIYGADDFDDKAEFIKTYLNEKKINKKNCYYIGDRVSDVKTAKKVGCISIVVVGKCAWDSKKEVLKENPDFVVSDIKNLSEVFECDQKCEHK